MSALETLTALPRWVAWRAEERNGRVTKVPYSPHGGKAEADDPATWGSREAASLVKGDGVGVQLGDGLAGIDLDSCRNAASGDIQTWATDLITAFASYTEVSPSGTGAKIFFRYAQEDLPALQAVMGTQTGKQWKKPGKNHPPGIELYLTGRYFAVTGQLLAGSPDAINIVSTEKLTKLITKAGPAFAGKTAAEPRQDTVTDRGDVYARAMAIPAVARRLNGDTDGLTDKSGSSVAQSVARSLYNERWWRGDVAAVLGQSPHTSKYGEGRDFDRIWKRCEEKPPTADVDGAPEFDGIAVPDEKITFHEFKRGVNPYGDLRWMVDKMLPERGVSALAGQYATGKTFVAVDLAVSIMTGEDFAGRVVGRSGAVLWLAAEGEAEIPIRLEGVMRYRSLPGDGLPFLWRDSIKPLLTKEGEAEAVAIAKAAKACKPDLALVIVDTLAAAAGWSDENNSAEGQRAIRILQAIGKSAGCPVLAIDHLGKDESAGLRGTTAKAAGVEAVLQVLGKRDNSGVLSDTVLALHKVRGARSGERLPFQLCEIGETCVVEWTAPTAAPQPDTKLSDINAAVLSVIDSLLTKAISVKLDTWRTAYVMAQPGGSKSAPRMRFNRAADFLFKQRLVAMNHLEDVFKDGDEFLIDE